MPTKAMRYYQQIQQKIENLDDMELIEVIN